MLILAIFYAYVIRVIFNKKEIHLHIEIPIDKNQFSLMCGTLVEICRGMTRFLALLDSFSHGR